MPPAPELLELLEEADPDELLELDDGQFLHAPHAPGSMHCCVLDSPVGHKHGNSSPGVHGTAPLEELDVDPALSGGI